MSTVRPIALTAHAAPADVEYPESDGRPVAETPVHYRNLTTIKDILERRYADDPMTYVGANMFVYYVRGKTNKRVAPDVFVARGASRDKDRRVYQVWEEDGHAPDVVFEFTSRSTRNEDQVKKLRIYRDSLAVCEYFLFDPKAEYLDPPLMGYRLRGGRYVRIKPVSKRLSSEVLGLHLERAGNNLRLYDPISGKWLPTAKEALLDEREARLHEREARLIAEQRAIQAEVENERLRRELESRRGK
ncbi:MAG TPA: Uma2 family endonuclease [Pirellulales bacterium]|jgi:Uma2 family endonuclease|nr:Uma2 family endonuclease [Pirellulales bacterium]